MLDVPRSARLAAWGSAFLAGDVRLPDLLRAVIGDDEPHQVAADPELPATAVPPIGAAAGAGLAGLLQGLHRVGCPGLQVVLPAPGDALGLPGPPAFNRDAIEAGECVLALPGPDGVGWGLVPEITEFGSAWEPGVLVTWSVRVVAPFRGWPPGGVADADRELRAVLAEATDLLAGLDLSGWRPDPGGSDAGLEPDPTRAADALRGAALAPRSLPPGLPPRAIRVLASAARVRLIVALAGEHPAVALDGWHEQRRADALRRLDTAGRHAVAAAANAPLEQRA